MAKKSKKEMFPERDCSRHRMRLMKGVCYVKNVARGYPPKRPGTGKKPGMTA